MTKKHLFIKNTESVLGSWTETVPILRIGLSVVADGSAYRAELKAHGEAFAGKGPSVVLAMQDLTAVITTAAIKTQRRGRAPDRVRVAATLLRATPNS